MRRLASLIASGALVLATGCGSTCESVCEDLNECPGNDAISTNCSGDCDAAEAAAERSGCTSQFEAYYDCLDEDPCDSARCSAQFEQYSACSTQ